MLGKSVKPIDYQGGLLNQSPAERPRVLLVVTKPIHREFLSEELLSTLEKSFDLTVAISAPLNETLDWSRERWKVVEIVSSPPSLYFFLANLMTLRHISKSKSFFTRSLIDLPWRSNRALRNTLESWPARLPKEFFFGGVKNVLFWVLSRRPIFPLIKRLLQSRLKVDDSVPKAFGEVAPHAVVLPSNGYDHDDYLITSFSRDSCIPILLVVNNWDNLSSKTVLLAKPDFVATIGKQSELHANSIHGVSSERIFSLGAARFDSRLQRTNLTNYPKPFVLFAGFSQPYDEARYLKLVASAVAQFNSVNQQAVNVVYRPHPWRLENYSTVESELSQLNNVFLDAESTRPRSLHDQHLKEDPRATATRGLILESLLVTGGPTSLILEALAIGKHCLILALDDDESPYSPRMMLDYYSHTEGISEVQMCGVAREEGQIVSAIVKALSQNFETFASGPKKVDEFVHLPLDGFPERFCQAIQTVLSHSE